MSASILHITIIFTEEFLSDQIFSSIMICIMIYIASNWGKLVKNVIYPSH